MAKKPKKDENAETKAAEETIDANSGPMLRVLAQYTRDSSFENPNAPDSLRTGQEPPKIDINIEIGRQMLDEDAVEVTLILRASASRGEQTVFIAELEYAGLFAFAGVGIEEIHAADEPSN